MTVLQRHKSQNRAKVLAWHVVAAVHLSEAAIRPIMLSKLMYDGCTVLDDILDEERIKGLGDKTFAAALRSEWWENIKVCCTHILQPVVNCANSCKHLNLCYLFAASSGLMNISLE